MTKEEEVDKYGFSFQYRLLGVELRNQGAVILNMLQDVTIEDNNGNVVKIFDGNGFPAFDNVDINGVPRGETYINDKGKKINHFKFNVKFS